jgi:hypothetical protein
MKAAPEVDPACDQFNPSQLLELDRDEVDAPDGFDSSNQITKRI